MRRFSVVALLFSLMLTVLIRPDTAGATPHDGPREGSGYTVAMPTTGRDWYGAYRMGETTAYCADLMSAPPRRATGWAEAPEGAPLVKQAGLAGSSTLPHGNGSVAATPADLADLSWVLTRSGQAPSADTGAAVEHFVRLRTVAGPDQAAREGARWSAVVAAHPGARAEFDRLTADAARFAGPYTAALEWERLPSLADPTGRLLASVVSRSGTLVPGVSLAVRGTGALTVTHAAAHTGTVPAEVDVALALPAADPTEGSLEVTFSGLPGNAPRVFVPTERTVQRLVAAPATQAVSATAAASLEPRFTPQVSTRTRDVLALPGEPAVDVVTVSGGRPGAPFEGTTTLYGPFPSLDALRAATPQESPQVGTARFSGVYGADGGAEVHSDELTFPEAGYFTWVETLAAAPFVTPPPPPAWPQLPETSLVLSPEVSTELTPHGAKVPGVEASDSVALAGVPGVDVPDATELAVRVSGRLVGPVPPRGTDGGLTCEGLDWSGAPVVGRYEDLVLAPGPDGFVAAGLAHSALGLPGCYSADATVTITHPSRDPIVVRHELGHPTQTVLIAEGTPQAPTAPRPERPGLPSTGA